MWQIINSYLSGVFTTIELMFFSKIVINTKIKKSPLKIIITIILLSLIYTILYLFTTGIIKTLIIFLINVFIYKFIYKTTYNKAILVNSLWLIILMIPDTLFLIIVIEILGYSKEECYNTIAGSVISNIVIYLLFIIITYILRKVLRKIVKYKIEDNIKIIIFSILTLVCILITFYNTFSNIKLNINSIISIFTMIVFVSILFSLGKQTLENSRLSKEYDKILEFMITYENEIEKQRILRHETKNEFRTIRAKLYDNQENKEIIEYIDEIVNDKYEIKQEKYAKFGYLPPNGIKGLCYFKTQEAENKGITVSINSSKKIKESSIYNLTIKQQRDFGRILGVFLDNAIEASMESKEKKLGIEAYTNTKKEFKLIITNTFNNKIEETRIGIEKFSTKEKTRGHGLLLVKQLVEKNNIFEIKTEIQEKIYIQTIIIKK